ncbi:MULTISPECIES: NAD(P)-dependent oxidoreductase [unclassified Crossiella]|uniref:NAD(P)-dependent oxidoreductase n=1 Tax=unclassified Crossiella TaxID=2620835 RepID=UPI001FFE7E35|nr:MULTISPECIES: SDR family oxidoreductase [unclassified Crossiella]MCK2237377.1 SDR family oxidoreductase [Crossiella sp. S99.2]MCK2251032.1 SDR family oxidoreductase [Crossiella sp. S99.1]
MNITVFGASGRTGEHVVQQALLAKHQVTAVVRNRAKLQLHHPALTIAQADVLDPAAITEHLIGRDAVISALGAGNLKPTTICTDSAESILRAMPKAGVRRLVVVSTSGATTEGDDPATRYLLKPILNRVFRHPWGDMRRMEELIMASDTDWTIVRPPRLTNAAHTGVYRIANGRNIPGGNSIPRADLADALLHALTIPSTVGTARTVAT